MMLPPPGATTTEPPFLFVAGGRETVRKGLSRVPLPFAMGTLPSSVRDHAWRMLLANCASVPGRYNAPARRATYVSEPGGRSAAADGTALPAALLARTERDRVSAGVRRH